MMYFNFFRFVSSKQTMFNPRSCLNQKKLRKNNAKLMSSKNGLEYSFLNILTRVFAHVIARELCHYQSKLVCSSHIRPLTRKTRNFWSYFNNLKCTQVIQLGCMDVFRQMMNKCGNFSCYRIIFSTIKISICLERVQNTRL